MRPPTAAEERVLRADAGRDVEARAATTLQVFFLLLFIILKPRVE